MVKRWWREVWFREPNRAPGSSPSECGPRREIMVLGQALVAGSVVQGAKLRVWVKHWWREVWSREPNRAPGSSPAPPECGPRREIMVLGQALMAGSMVQGAKLRFWVKLRLARVWSEEKNYGLGSNDGGGKCGPGRETAVLGQALPRPSVVRGEKLWSWVKRWWREVWSREPNCGFGSSTGGGKYGPGSQTATPGQAPPKYGPGSQTVPPGHPQPRYGPGRETAAPGQARPRPSVVQGAKLRVWVKHWWREVWSREPNCGLGSSPSPPKYGPGSQTAAQVTPCPAKVWSREQNRAPGSSQAPPECGLGSKTVPPGQARPRQSMV